VITDFVVGLVVRVQKKVREPDLHQQLRLVKVMEVSNGETR
jgi:hypothetical protein